MQAIGLGLLVLASLFTIVYVTTADRSDVGSPSQQVALSLSIGVLGAAIALILQIDLIPDEWEVGILIVGALAAALVALWRYRYAP
jgi:hypothetical protein